MRIEAWLGVGFGIAVALGACSDDSENGSTASAGGTGTQKLGVGDVCTEDSACRPGLTCESTGGQNTCQPAGTLAEGEDCVISAECGDDLYCESGVCAPAGSGGEGDPCENIGDCQKGYTCEENGGTCTAIGDETGKGDVGDSCMESGDCYSPLVCGSGGTCQEPGGSSGSGGSGSGGTGAGGTGSGGSGGSVMCIDNGDCMDDHCVCPDCDTDFFCSDPAQCMNDGQCKTFEEGCVCADCMSHPHCLDN